MKSATTTTGIASAMIASGLALAAASQVWAVDWPPNPPSTPHQGVTCRKAKGFGGEGICYGIPVCAGNTTGHCAGVPYAVRAEVRIIGLCDQPQLASSCYSFNDYWACAYVQFSWVATCDPLDPCELYVGAGPNVCDWTALGSGTGS